MKILFYLVRFPAFGGIESVTNIIGTELISSGDYFIDIITNIRGDRDMSLMHHANLFVFPNSTNWYSGENRKYMKNVLEEGHYDALVYQDSYSGMERIVVGEAFNKSIPVYAFEHNSPLWFASNNKRKSNMINMLMDAMVLRKRLFHNRRSKKFLLEHCTKYVLLSDKFKDDLRKVVNTDPYIGKITSIPNPIAYSPIEESKLGEKDNVILTVCQLNKTKNVSLMLEMWAALSKRLPSWRYVIVGDGVERVALEQQVRDNEIPNVEFVGFANPQPYYEKAKIFWMASKHEGWGMTLVEAMQKGCVPVVMNTFSSLTDIVNNGENGIIVPANDTKTFEDNSYLLASEKDYYIKLAQNAINSVERFNVKQVVMQWNALLSY